MFISEVVTERGPIFVLSITILTIDKFSLMMLVPNMSVDRSSVDPLVTVLTLNFVYIYKRQILTTDLKIFLRLQNSMSCTFVLLEAPLAFKSSATDGTNTGFGLRVFDCNVSVDIFLSNGNPTVKALNHIRIACKIAIVYPLKHHGLMV